jgi:hypothetical protein
VAQTVVVGADPVRVAEVRVVGRSKCLVRHASGLDVAVLWAEARKALTAAALTREQGKHLFVVGRYERVYDPPLKKVVSETNTQQRQTAERPFVALPADSLARVGYVRRDSTGGSYYAPDGDVLLSDVFVGTHCLRLEPAPKGAPGLLGIAFAPAERRDGITDIEGVLWLDAASGELRHLEYRYTNLPREVSTDRLGGRVEFLRLPTGAWIISRWAIRVPVMGVRRRVFQTGEGGGAPGALASTAAPTRMVLTGIKEDGGEVLEVRAGEQVIWTATSRTPTGA